MQPDRGTADDSEQILQSWVVTEALRQLSTEHRPCCAAACLAARGTRRKVGRLAAFAALGLGGALPAPDSDAHPINRCG